ncbi:hypothetical protein QP027_09085 [Corynebacterium breve]|uniref:Uncharacterized protein n=1 Tax=Corynebacterium breve TaxID=3049799 RepID=A0ABY8VDS9_9CORY|nr:hypothetical protein [Corynebacterium breve]WIM67262.1 hypothetical protein QP027_09085 [Corynebacterium breve]
MAHTSEKRHRQGSIPVLVPFIAILAVLALIAAMVFFTKAETPVAQQGAVSATGDDQLVAAPEETAGSEDPHAGLPEEPKIEEGGTEAEHFWSDAPVDPAVEELLDSELITDTSFTVHKNTFVGDYSRVTLNGSFGVRANKDAEELFDLVEKLTQEFCFNSINLSNLDGPSVNFEKACGNEGLADDYFAVWEQVKSFNGSNVVYNYGRINVAHRVQQDGVFIPQVAEQIKDFTAPNNPEIPHTIVSVGDRYGAKEFILEPGEVLGDVVAREADWMQEAPAPDAPAPAL